jgi:hypothetical protein
MQSLEQSAPTIANEVITHLLYSAPPILIPDPIQVEAAPKKFPSPRRVDRVPVEFAAAVGSIRGRRVGAVGSRRRSELAARFGGAVSGDRGQHQP